MDNLVKFTYNSSNLYNHTNTHTQNLKKVMYDPYASANKGNLN